MEDGPEGTCREIHPCNLDERPPTSEGDREIEPVTNDAPVPIWLIVSFAVLLYWGLIYLSENAAGFHSQVYSPFRSIEELARGNPQSKEDLVFAQGRRLYLQYCAPCHQPTGLGSPGIAPPLAGSEWVASGGPTRLIRIVLHGLHGPIEVKGRPWNGVMPAWGNMLSNDDDIAAILTFLRQNREWGNSAPPVTSETVRAIREKTTGRAEYWTARELLEIPDTE